jgi:hypothetical protein
MPDVSDAATTSVSYAWKRIRSAPNSEACASANEKAFWLAGISDVKRMVEGLLQPGLITAAMGTS